MWAIQIGAPERGRSGDSNNAASFVRVGIEGEDACDVVSSDLKIPILIAYVSAMFLEEAR